MVVEGGGQRLDALREAVVLERERGAGVAVPQVVLRRRRAVAQLDHGAVRVRERRGGARHRLRGVDEALDEVVRLQRRGVHVARRPVVRRLEVEEPRDARHGRLRVEADDPGLRLQEGVRPADDVRDGRVHQREQARVADVELRPVEHHVEQQTVHVDDAKEATLGHRVRRGGRPDERAGYAAQRVGRVVEVERAQDTQAELDVGDGAGLRARVHPADVVQGLHEHLQRAAVRADVRLRAVARRGQ